MRFMVYIFFIAINGTSLVWSMLPIAHGYIIYNKYRNPFYFSYDEYGIVETTLRLMVTLANKTPCNTIGRTDIHTLSSLLNKNIPSINQTLEIESLYYQCIITTSKNPEHLVGLQTYYQQAADSFLRTPVYKRGHEAQLLDQQVLKRNPSGSITHGICGYKK